MTTSTTSGRAHRIARALAALAALSGGCANAPRAASSAPAPVASAARDPRFSPPPLARALAPVAWLEGRWVSEDARSEETWTNAGNVLVGVSFEAKGGTTSAWEALAVEGDDGAPTYVAMPNGRPPTPFRAREVAGSRAVFANPAHDFPKTLDYARDGDQLHARVAGDGKGLDYTFRARPPEPAAELEEADRRFDDDVAGRGIEAWVDAFDPAGAMLRKDGRAEGHVAVRETMAPMFASGTKLRWAPIASGWSPARDLGFTVGRYVSHRDASDAGPARDGRGTYVTIWKRGSDGRARVLFDTGFPES